MEAQGRTDRVWAGVPLNTPSLPLVAKALLDQRTDPPQFEKEAAMSGQHGPNLPEQHLLWASDLRGWPRVEALRVVEHPDPDLGGSVMCVSHRSALH